VLLPFLAYMDHFALCTTLICDFSTVARKVEVYASAS
jgi:hypothetical protein